MQTKQSKLSELFEQTSNQVTSSLANWTELLDTVGRLYKYPFHEQLMIHAQNPKATACAEYDLWNKTMNRYVRQGSKGIALIDPTKEKSSIKYVFDVSDTGGREKSRKPFLWEMQEHHEELILKMLQDKFNVDGNNLTDLFDNLANNLAKEYYEDSKRDIGYLVEDSFLEELDEDNIRVIFEDAVSTSIMYTLMKRCGLDIEDYFNHEDFSSIFDFNTPTTVTLLGSAVSKQTEQVFREISNTIVKTERSIQNEQSNVQTRGGLSNSQRDTNGATNSNTRKIWENEKNTPNGTQGRTLELPADEREIIPTSNGNRPNSQQKNGANDERPASETASTQQNETPNGMGGTHEQSTSWGRGSDTGRTDLQLNATEQLSLFPTEEQQIKTIADRQSENTHSVTHESPSAISLSQDEKVDVDETSLAPNQHIETIDGTEFIFTEPLTNAMREQSREVEITPFFKQYLDIKSEYPNNIVLYPLGDFFEAFNDDAKFMANELGLTLVSREIKGFEERVPMIGIPSHSLDSYMERLHAVNQDVVLVNNENGIKTPMLVKANAPAQEISETEITQTDIENSILEWNGDNQSKARVLEYMQAHGRERGTARFLQGEFGGNLNAFEVTNGETKDIIPWAKVQRLLGQLVDENKFHITNEQNQEQTISQAKTTTPEVIFFEDLKQIDIDYSKYADGDLIGYNTDGVRFNVGKSGDLTYTTQTTSILPTGEVLGDSMTAEIFTKWQEWKSSLEKDEVKIEPILEQKQPNEPKKANIENSKGENFHITNNQLGEGKPREKFAKNIQAIKTLQEIESENRTATSAEQQILSEYIGFGGLSEAFDKTNNSWSSEYHELKSLLTDDEYEKARASVLNAHYTSPVIINSIYETVEKMGFTNGNILEPSMGTGNFFGMLPETMKNSNLYGIELDSITGRIAKQLYPQANIEIKGFEKTDLPDNFFDIAIGNVPFGNYKLNEKRYDGNVFMIHDHFFGATRS